ncbi:MAG: phosphomannomutase/phosphoglucomutase [Pseudomonadales bacterium]|nr:phosphomannomutase/phosphoglucomutase [Pseudomonadales bacterium]
MAIGKKKLKAENTVKGKDTAKANSGTAEKGGSLLVPFLPALIGGLVTTLACVAAIYWFFVISGGDKSQQAYAQSRAHGYVTTLSQQALQLQTTVINIAKSDAIRDALTRAADVDTNKERFRVLEEALANYLPHVSNVKVFAKGEAKKDTQATPPISFAQLDLISRAEKKETPLPEIHPHETERFLTLAAAIEHNGKVIGSLFATFDLKSLTKSYPKVENSWGYLELIQQFTNTQPFVFYQSGNQASKQNQPAEVSGAIKHWKAAFYPSVAANIAAQQSGLFFAICGATLGLLIIFIMVSYLSVNRALTQNATKLTSNFNALTNHDKTKQNYSLSIFNSLSKTIERLFKEYDSQVRHQALKNKDVSESSATEALGQGLSRDDVLDIDINDDDHSIFTGEDSDDPLAFDDNPDAMALDVVEMADGNSTSGPIDPKSIPSDIFRAYDIRGIVGQSLTEDTAHSIGQAIGSEAISKGQTSIIIARDGRSSSESLASALLNGLMSTGINVIDIGMLPTPMLYYATKTLNTQSGVMITGSHNPPEYNGFKVVIADQTLSGEGILALKERIENGNLSHGEGHYETHDISQDYKDRILNDVVLAKPMRVVLDCGNGVSGMVATDILNNLGCSVTTLYGDVDGSFPNHHPDPSKPENLEALINAVKEQEAELGIAFDGDGDRLGVVTASGKIIWPDRLLMLYARDLLSRNPGSDIIYDVKCSRDVAELVSNLGGRAIMSATGHSLMKAKMAETGAAVGGELSGHIFFNDRWYGFDDATYAAARLLEILSMEPFGVDEVFAELPEKVSTPELSIPVSDEKKFTLISRLSEQGQFSDGNMVTLDGIRVDYPDGWGLVRASNTTPSLVARFEADSEEALERIKGIFRDQLRSVDANIEMPF